MSCSYLYHILLFPRLIHLRSDIEKNPGPTKDFSQTFCFGYCNINCSVTHNFTKVALLKSYLSVPRFNIFYISETYLNSIITEGDDSLQIPGYDLMIHTRKNLYFTELSTKIHWNTRLAASDVFHMFTQSINFF